jgi:hypothetical protein
MPQKILEWEQEGKQRKGSPKERWMDRWSKMEHDKHGLTEEDTRDRNTWRNLILSEGKPL